jgi:hypothetical protein
MIGHDDWEFGFKAGVSSVDAESIGFRDNPINGA